MVCSNYMNFIQQRHAAGQKREQLPLSHHLLGGLRTNVIEWLQPCPFKLTHVAAPAWSDSSPG